MHILWSTRTCTATVRCYIARQHARTVATDNYALIETLLSQLHEHQLYDPSTMIVSEEVS